MLTATMNHGATAVIVIAADLAAPALEAQAETAVIPVVAQAAAATVRAVLASKAGPGTMIVPPVPKSRVPWPCPPD